MPTEEEDRGFAQIPRWLQRRTDVSVHAKAVYLALSSRADPRGQSFPSHETLAEEASCSIATVKRALLQLRELGVVTWVSRPRDEGGRSSNLYTITVGQPVDNSSSAIAQPELFEGQIAHTELGGSSHRAMNENQLTIKNINPPSSNTSRTQKPVENDDDQASATVINFPTPTNVSKLHPRAIDRAQLAASVGFYFLDAGITDDQLHAIALGILGKATTHVTNPTKYVISAIRNDVAIYQRQAFDLAAGGRSSGRYPS